MFKVKELAEKVNNLSQNSSTDIVEIGLAFYEAKEHLDDAEYADFLQLTHYESKSSMIRKWIGIGKSYQRFKSIQSKLPPVFTTIYTLAKMPDADYLRLMKSDILKVSVTTKEINDFLNPQKTKNKQPRLIIEFNNLSNEYQLKEMFDFIESTYSSYIKIKMNDECKDLLEAANSKSHLTLKAA
jgi:hypothetical protein